MFPADHTYHRLQALRMSLEEERARQTATQRNQDPSSTSATPLDNISEQPTASSDAPATSLPADLSSAAASGPASALAVNTPSSNAVVGPTEAIPSDSASAIKTEDAEIDMDEDEDADLAAALALSRGGDVEMGESTQEAGDDAEEELTEEEAMARAIAMSMQEQKEQEERGQK